MLSGDALSSAILIGGKLPINIAIMDPFILSTFILFLYLLFCTILRDPFFTAFVPAIASINLTVILSYFYLLLVSPKEDISLLAPVAMGRNLFSLACFVTIINLVMFTYLPVTTNYVLSFYGAKTVSLFLMLVLIFTYMIHFSGLIELYGFVPNKLFCDEGAKYLSVRGLFRPVLLCLGVFSAMEAWMYYNENWNKKWRERAFECEEEIRKPKNKS